MPAGGAHGRGKLRPQARVAGDGLAGLRAAEAAVAGYRTGGARSVSSGPGPSHRQAGWPGAVRKPRRQPRRGKGRARQRRRGAGRRTWRTSSGRGGEGAWARRVVVGSEGSSDGRGASQETARGANGCVGTGQAGGPFLLFLARPRPLRLPLFALLAPLARQTPSPEPPERTAKVCPDLIFAVFARSRRGGGGAAQVHTDSSGVRGEGSGRAKGERTERAFADTESPSRATAQR